tara:strand:- start:386 stop:559 length:174 start_codon:yes stop_codon:yes gene_type:complete
MAAAYAWEPFVVKGPEMDYVAPVETLLWLSEAPRRFKPSAEFLQEWENLASSKSGTQ